MKNLVVIQAVWMSLVGVSALAQTAPPPASPLTQKNTGLTQKNTSGLSQNMMGRTATATETETAINPGGMYPGIAVPQAPQAIYIGPGTPPVQAVPPPVSTDNPGAAAPSPEASGVSPGGQAAPQAPVSGSGSAMPETTGNE